MSLLVNILDTYYMAGLWKGLSPVNTFFRDRYFPTEAGDIFKADKVLCEYQDGDTGMAPFMVERADPDQRRSPGLRDPRLRAGLHQAVPQPDRGRPEEARIR